MSVDNKGKGVNSNFIAQMPIAPASSGSSSRLHNDLPSSHFLSQSGGLPASSSWSGRKDFRHRQEGSISSDKGSRYSALLEAQSLGSLSNEDHDQLSHIPAQFLDDFSVRNQIQSRSERNQNRAYMPDTSTLAAADFDVDVRSGFLPPEQPVTRLEGIEEEVWESALDKAPLTPLHIGGGNLHTTANERVEALRWRKSIREMIVLHPSPQIISDIRYARRAHQVLSFLAHYYLHSQAVIVNPAPESASWYTRWTTRSISAEESDQKKDLEGKYNGVVPASIAVPWVALSNSLDLPPVLTYADSVMWNWHLKDPSKPFTAENVDINTTFTGTESEKHFYKTSVLIERRGVAALTLMRQSLDEAFMGGNLAKRRITLYLQRLSRVIDDLAKILYNVRSDCDPAVFYWGIRPWLNGGDSGIDRKTGEKGWIFEGVEEYQGKRKLFTGPSAGQSTLIHSLDVFLGVDHAKRGTRRNQSASEQENATFMEKMQLYMPGHHRNFLTHLKGISFSEDDQELHYSEEEADEQEILFRAIRRHPIRSLMMEESDDTTEKLKDAYNLVLTSLKHLRDEHMRVATLYIVQQMKMAAPLQYTRSDAIIPIATLDDTQEVVKGTGGTDLVSFLRDCRKNTIAALYR